MLGKTPEMTADEGSRLSIHYLTYLLKVDVIVDVKLTKEEGEYEIATSLVEKSRLPPWAL